MKKNLEWLKQEINDNGISALDLDDNELVIELDMINEFLDQLDEPEVLSLEWIDEYAQGDYDEWVYTEDLQNLLVPKQELPVIPKFVAEFLIGKEDYMLYELFDDEWLYKEHDRVAKWLYDNDELTNKQREIDLVMARNRGHLVGEEQKYYVILEENSYGAMGLGIGREGRLTFTATHDKWSLPKLTEQEIKDYDERFWPFAVKVEELEE